MADRPVPHLRLVHNGPRSDHFQDGVITGRPKISPNHPAWGKTPWEERFPDGGQDEYPKTQTSGAGGGKKPPLKLVTALGDDGEGPEQPSLFEGMESKKPKKPKNSSKQEKMPKKGKEEWQDTPLYKDKD
jgi:hypothetical protein